MTYLGQDPRSKTSESQQTKLGTLLCVCMALPPTYPHILSRCQQIDLQAKRCQQVENRSRHPRQQTPNCRPGLERWRNQTSGKLRALTLSGTQGKVGSRASQAASQVGAQRPAALSSV